MPESLDPAGYTELTAVLDDVRASVDPSFTPTAVPSEPADVTVEDGEHEDEGGADARRARRGRGRGAVRSLARGVLPVLTCRTAATRLWRAVR